MKANWQKNYETQFPTNALLKNEIKKIIKKKDKKN
jgi:hypothetical protein